MVSSEGRRSLVCTPCDLYKLEVDISILETDSSSTSCAMIRCATVLSIPLIHALVVVSYFRLELCYVAATGFP